MMVESRDERTGFDHEAHIPTPVKRIATMVPIDDEKFSRNILMASCASVQFVMSRATSSLAHRIVRFGDRGDEGD